MDEIGIYMSYYIVIFYMCFDDKNVMNSELIKKKKYNIIKVYVL